MSAPQTIFCAKCVSVRSYPFATSGQPTVPVEFVRRGLCDSCKPWAHEIIETAQADCELTNGVLSCD